MKKQIGKCILKSILNSKEISYGKTTETNIYKITHISMYTHTYFICMCVYIYIYTYIHTYIHTHTYAHIYISACMCIYIYIYASVCARKAIRRFVLTELKKRTIHKCAPAHLWPWVKWHPREGGQTTCYHF